MDVSALLMLTETGLAGQGPRPAHRALICWLIAQGQAPHGARLAEQWLPASRGVARAELLCALAWAQGTQGLQVQALLHQAETLAAAEWTEPERAWGALGSARLALGDRIGAHQAWTHPESPYHFDALRGMTALACAHRQAGDWTRLETALAHIGPGHDQAQALEQVIADALRREALGDALSALWWIPEPLREGALLRAVWGLVRADRAATGWAIEAQWDGLEDGPASRALARLLLGDADGARCLLDAQAAPLHRAGWLYQGIARLALADVGGALQGLARLEGLRLRLHGARLAALLFPGAPWPSLLARLAGQATTTGERLEVARVWGRLEGPAGHNRLRAAADEAAQLEDFYAQRLALQALAHTQIQAGDVAGGLETASRLSSTRFAEEHRIAAAIWRGRAGDLAGAAAILADLPAARRGEAGVTVLEGVTAAADEMLLAWDICVT